MPIAWLSHSMNFEPSGWWCELRVSRSSAFPSRHALARAAAANIYAEKLNEGEATGGRSCCFVDSILITRCDARSAYLLLLSRFCVGELLTGEVLRVTATRSCEELACQDSSIAVIATSHLPVPAKDARAGVLLPRDQPGEILFSHLGRWPAIGADLRRLRGIMPCS